MKKWGSMKNLRCSPGNEEDPDGQEEEEQKGEDDGDVGKGPEPQHTQQQELHHLRPMICR